MRPSPPATLVHDHLTRTARRYPDRVALIADGRRVSFAELDVESGRLAAALQQEGVGRGDRVAIFLDNSWELVVALFGTLKAGGVWVPVNPTTREDKLRYLLRDSGSRGLVTHRRLGDVALPAIHGSGSLQAVWWVDGASPAAGPESKALSFDDAIASGGEAPSEPPLIDQDLAGIIYTSGSTGQPKGVMLTHRNVVNTARAISTYLENVPEDVVLCGLPLSFDYGLFQVLTGVRVGFTVVIERSFAFPWQILERMEEHRVTGLPGVPTLFASLLHLAPFQGVDLSSLRYLTNTAASFPPAHIRRWRELLPHARIYSMYGLTECTRVSYLAPEDLDDHMDSVGKAMPNCEMYVVDERGRRVPPGTVGELMVRGANVMRGYWRNPDATARRLVEGEIPGEKVLRTGDLFRMDGDGFFTFVGRKDDVFKCRGEKVSPKEVEDVLYRLEGVAEAAITGVKHPLDGRAVKAFVVPAEGSGLTERDVRRHCRAHLESRLVPRYLEFCDALPRTESGKLRAGAVRR